MANEKKYQKIYTCPHCGSRNYVESDYEPVKGKEEGTTYQWYSCICTDCGKKFYNVALYLGAMTADQFNELVDDEFNNFKDEPEDHEERMVKRMLEMRKQH